MDRAIAAAEANRHFSTVLRHVAAGQRYVITSRGRPVARIVPIDAEDDARQTALASLLAHIENVQSQPAIIAGPWTRDDLYDRD
jgi:prevent-host-death family protein